MKQFSLETPTRVTVTNVNLRDEMHGKDHVPAVDIAFRLTASNTILDGLVPPLRAMIYQPAGEEDEQPELDGVDAITDLPLLRCEDIEPQRIKTKLTGYSLNFDYGLGGNSNIQIPVCSVDKFVADCKQGGSVDLTFRVQASHISSDTIGKLGVMIGLEQAITLLPPFNTEVIDGSNVTPLKGKDKPDPTGAFLAAQGS